MKINPALNFRREPSFTKKSQSKKNVDVFGAVRKIGGGVNPSIFKAYDIRGIYPGQVNEDVAYLIGGVFLKFFKKRKKPIIVVGSDNRISSPSLKKGLIKGVLDGGGNVIDIGLCSTPMFYFSIAHFGFDGGVQITASHLPPQYNGFKFVREKAIPVDEKTGLKEIKEILRFPTRIQKKKKGNLIKKNFLKDYLKFNLKDFDLKRMGSLKIVIDTGNAITGVLIPKIFKYSNFQIFHLFPELDGNFPNRPPDCLKRGALKKLKEEVLKKKADLGIAFDGDGDRIVFVDERSNFVSPDIITALIASLLLKEKPRERILYTVRSSKIIPDVVREKRGKSVIWMVGRSYIGRKIRKENILFGGEFSGHYYLRDYYFCEAPLFVLFKILEELSRTKQKFSEILKPFKKYFHSGEINFKVKNPERILKILEKKYKKGKLSHLDGLKVDFRDWWFNIRFSRTEPLLRLVVEAKTKKLMQEKKKELSSLITRNL